MSMSRRERRAAKAAAPAPVPAASPPADHPDPSIAERLLRLEQSAPKPWSLADEHAPTVAAWRRANVRHDAAAPCPACGVIGGEQRLKRSAFLSGLWLCVPDADAVTEGWGTSTTTHLGEGQARDRLAALATGQEAPTPGLCKLLSRYGLRLVLAREAGPDSADGTPWAHLGDRARWQEAGQRAVERHAAGWPVAPFDPGMPFPETTLHTGYDPFTSEYKVYTREVPGTGPTPEELAAQLRVEEEQITASLAERARAERRAAKERQAKEQQDRHQRAVHEHYAQHKAQLEAQIRDARARLAAGLDAVLAEPTTGWLCQDR